VKPEDLYSKSETLLRKILFENLPANTEIFLFGSRAKGNFTHCSDIDIGLASIVPLDQAIARIREIIENSFIPYKVDIIDLSKTSQEFKAKALSEVIKWNMNIS
jgi:uncharacterized protein